MRIGIDARLIDETGVGRYVRNLISEVSLQDKTNEYVVFLPPKRFAEFLLPNVRWSKVSAFPHWHTLSEQMVMPKLLDASRLDLVHIPYHNPPLMYRGRMVITIHDLTILHFATGKATTLPLPLYYLKRLAYWIELWIGLRKATGIIAVSETTKKEIVDHFHIPSDKIAVTYEGVDTALVDIFKKRIIQHPYFLYVGNAYPHKNIETLLEGFALFIHSLAAQQKLKLVLVGSDDFFYRRLKTHVGKLSMTESVMFFGPANDAQLISLYQHARAFVFPSRMEGFGLPALEALSLGCRVCVSDIPVFHEILGDKATYFDQNSAHAIAKTLGHVWSERRVTPEVLPDFRKFAGTYSWQKMARETLDIYERSTRI
ncbi:MAG: glycosyltransferase family 1 protein [Patescibacteria group bacterium]